jgi:hypothetical protein
MMRRKERKFFGRLCSFTTVMKEIPKRKTVTSSLDEISTDQLGNRVVVRGERHFYPPLFLQQASIDRYSKTTGTVFSSTSIFAS